MSVKNYTVAQPFWRQGILLREGEALRLTDAEAKHIRHLLNEVKPKADEPAPAPEPEPKPEPVRVDPEATKSAARIVATVKSRAQKA